MIKNISNLGDAALYCDFGSEVNKEINSKVIRYFKSIQKENIDGINNLTPSYNKLIISFDLRKKNFQTIKKLIENLDITNDDELETNRIKIPVCCDENFSLDIKRLEERLKINREKIYENFFDKEYQVNFVCLFRPEAPVADNYLIVIRKFIGVDSLDQK
mgnify:CR=1 FL=1